LPSKNNFYKSGKLLGKKRREIYCINFNFGLQNSPIPFHPYVSRAKFAVVRFIGLARKRKPGEGQNVEDRVIDAVILGAFREISQNG
jgi:hypothetical protein